MGSVSNIFQSSYNLPPPQTKIRMYVRRVPLFLQNYFLWHCPFKKYWNFTTQNLNISNYEDSLLGGQQPSRSLCIAKFWPNTNSIENNDHCMAKTRTRCYNAYIRWKLRTCCARVIKKLHFLKKKIQFDFFFLLQLCSFIPQPLWWKSGLLWEKMNIIRHC